VVSSLTGSGPGDVSGRVRPAATPNSSVLLLNGSSLPRPSEFVMTYSEILFRFPTGASESSDFTSVAMTEAASQYFCLGYVGLPCISLSPPATWPAGTMGFEGGISGENALAQALFEIRGGVGNKLVDGAVMRAWGAESLQRADIRNFVETINKQLDNHAEFARESFAAHGIPTN
jgi:hypothetical protein